MVCCTLIALILGVILWVIRKASFGTLAAPPNPIQWSLETAETATGSARFSWADRARSFGYAINGLRTVLREEHNAWLHIIMAATAITLGFWLQIDVAAWRWIIACIGLVLFAETVNTAIEAICDVVSPAHNPAIGLAKDIAAGAVLICAVTALIIGTITLVPFALDHTLGLAVEIFGS